MRPGRQRLADARLAGPRIEQHQPRHVQRDQPKPRRVAPDGRRDLQRPQRRCDLAVEPPRRTIQTERHDRASRGDLIGVSNQRIPRPCRSWRLLFPSPRPHCVSPVIQWFYGWELASAGLLPRTYGPAEILLSTFTVHAASFLACLALGVGAGVVAHRVHATLVTALSASRRQAADLAEVEVSLAAALEAEKRRASDLTLLSDAAEALSGPLGAAEIATQFLQRVRRAVGDSPTVAVVISDERARAFRVIGAVGPRAEALTGQVIPYAALPGEWRTEVTERREPLAVPDTAAVGESWRTLAARVPGLDAAGCSTSTRSTRANGWWAAW